MKDKEPRYKSKEQMPAVTRVAHEIASLYRKEQVTGENYPLQWGEILVNNTEFQKPIAILMRELDLAKEMKETYQVKTKIPESYFKEVIREDARGFLKNILLARMTITQYIHNLDDKINPQIEKEKMVKKMKLDKRSGKRVEELTLEELVENVLLGNLRIVHPSRSTR